MLGILLMTLYRNIGVALVHGTEVFFDLNENKCIGKRSKRMYSSIL